MAPATNQRAQRPAAGDYTGREKTRQGREAAQQQKERSAETTLATAERLDEEEHGVFDAQSGVRLDTPDGEIIDDDEDVAPQAPPAFAGTGFFPDDEDDEPVLTGHESDEELAPILAARDVPRRGRRRSPRAHSADVVIRLDQDIDDMTYGMDPVSQSPNNYSFKEGLKYKVPYPVAEHLDERGLVRQWISR